MPFLNVNDELKSFVRVEKLDLYIHSVFRTRSDKLPHPGVEKFSGESLV